jgi:oxygen-independent coproporphyrinogen-3 oxidase
MEVSLYIHVPFCSGSCDYCDFYSVPVTSPDYRDPRLKTFVETLLSEGRGLFQTFLPVRIPTVYIGGGTPSVLGQTGIAALLNGVTELISRTAPGPEEITVEANPESADEAFHAAAREGGATRLSLGLQTFHGPSRRAVNRIGLEQCSDESWLLQRLALAAEYFPGALSLDLISGLPFQDEKILLNDIYTALSYKPAHVSLYALTLEPHTPLAEKNAEKPLLPPGDEADRLWLCGRDALEKAGYRQYEVSNFCLGGKESRHNIRYWRMKNWLALGPAASGTMIDDETGTGIRYTIPPDVDTWLEKGLRGNLSRKGAEKQRTQSGCFKTPRFPSNLLDETKYNNIENLKFPSASFAPLRLCENSFEELDSRTLIKETFLMGFRYVEGPDEELFQRRFHRSIADCIPKTLEAWRSHGLLQNNKYALTREGLLFLDPFLAEAFLELDARAARDAK